MEINDYQQVWDIWLESKDKLKAYTLSRFKDKELAEEVTQEVLLKVHGACCSEKQINNVDSWLYQIAHNTSIDIIRKRTKSRELQPPNQMNEQEDKWKDLSHFLLPLIKVLPNKYGEPLLQSDIYNIPQKEIAKQLGLGISATKSRIQRARQMLKEEIQICFELKLDKNGVPSHAELKDSCIIKK